MASHTDVSKAGSTLFSLFLCYSKSTSVAKSGQLGSRFSVKGGLSLSGRVEAAVALLLFFEIGKVLVGLSQER